MWTSFNLSGSATRSTIKSSYQSESTFLEPNFLLTWVPLSISRNKASFPKDSKKSKKSKENSTSFPSMKTNSKSSQLKLQTKSSKRPNQSNPKNIKNQKRKKQSNLRSQCFLRRKPNFTKGSKTEKKKRSKEQESFQPEELKLWKKTDKKFKNIIWKWKAKWLNHNTNLPKATRIENVMNAKRLPIEWFVSPVSTLYVWIAFVKGFFRKRFQRRLIYQKSFVLCARMSLRLLKRFSKLSWIMLMNRVTRRTKNVLRLLKRKADLNSRVLNWKKSR